MAGRRIIVPGAMPSRDENGRALPAKFRFYVPDAAFTTLAPVYSDEALTVPYSQPIISDQAGRWPQIWADELSVFDVGWYTLDTDAAVSTFTSVSPADDAVLASVDLAESAADAAEMAQSGAEAAQAVVEGIASQLGDIDQAVIDAEAAAAAAAQSAQEAATFDPSNYVPITRAISGGGLATGGGALNTDRTISVTAASGAQSAALSDTDKAMTPGGLGSALAFVNDGTGSGSYTPDLAAGPHHRRIANGNSTLANMSNPKAGEPFYFRLGQDATGGRTWSFGSGYKFAGGAPSPSITANAVDAISGIVLDPTTPLFDCVFVKGIS